MTPKPRRLRSCNDAKRFKGRWRLRWASTRPGAIGIASLGAIGYHGRFYIGGSMLGLIMLLFFSMSRWYTVSLPILLLLGLGTSGFGTMQSAIVMLRAREEMRGRALGVISLAIGAGPLGALMIGAIASMSNASLAIGIHAALGIAALSLVALLMPKLWRRPMVPDKGAPEKEGSQNLAHEKTT